MFKSTASRLCTALASAAILTASLALSPTARAESEQSQHGLTGAWWVTVTQYNCATGAKRPSFSSILLFSRGGTLTEATSNPGFLPGQRSTGFGSWSQSDNGTYAASDVAFIQFTTPGYTPGPPPLGFLAGTQKISHVINLNNHASQFTDEAIVQFFDTTSSTPYLSGCASAVGVRLQ